MSLRGLVDLAKLRWRIERDYHDLKQEIGLGHYGGGWQGFHHHATPSIAAYGFLISERERISPPQHKIPPLQSKICRSQWLSTPWRPRSGRSATSQPDCHDSSPAGRHECDDLPAMPMLYPPISATQDGI